MKFKNVNDRCDFEHFANTYVNKGIFVQCSHLQYDHVKFHALNTFNFLVNINTEAVFYDDDDKFSSPLGIRVNGASRTYWLLFVPFGTAE